MGLLGAALCLWGCPDRSKSVAPAPAPAVVVQSAAELQPTQLRDSFAVLSQTGSEYTVNIKDKVLGDTFTISLLRHGEVFDTEKYRILPGGFAVEYVAGETFDPPIPILRFPMKLGERWTWQGKIGSTSAVPAEASVRTEQKQVYSCGVPIDAVQVQVDLTVRQNGQISRRLTFFFAKGHGLFRREFGATSVREPVCR